MEDGGDGNLAESKKAATTEEKEGCLVFSSIQAHISGSGTDGLGSIWVVQFLCHSMG